MPVTVRPANHQAREWTARPATSDLNLLQASCRDEFDHDVSTQFEQVIQPSSKDSENTNVCPSSSRFARLQAAFRAEFGGDVSTRPKQVNCIQSSFKDLTNTNICPSSNGFVCAVFAAYSHHHHLSIRPEDVWFTILSQLSFYINAHAEELRSSFVAHEGQKELVVSGIGTIQTVDVGGLAVRLTHEMEQHLVDAELREWIMPNFSTTTATDTIVAAIIMMGSMQKYFSYKMSMCCGIPSVTLLGEKADWVEIRRRVDKLASFGKETEQFSLLLAPILDYFIRTFDNTEDAKVVEFWTKIAHQHSNSSGPSYLSGWITAFCFWDSKGKLLFREPRGDVGDDDLGQQGCNIDGTVYHRVDTSDIPEAYVSVPVTVDDNGIEFKTRMVAGLVGIEVSSSGEKLDNSNRPNVWVEDEPGGLKLKEDISDEDKVTGLDSLQPVAGWWMYELKG
jgi:hypothetical protein